MKRILRNGCAKAAALLVAWGMPVTAQVWAGELTVEVNGAKLHVEVDGDPSKPAVILWNGAYCTTHMWDNTIEALTRHFRVVRFDVRGTGQSSPSATEDGYTMEQYADDAIAILDGLGVDKALVWCMAWGSRAGVVFAARYPERVRLLALYDASVHRADVQAQGEGRERAFKKQVEAGIPLIERPEKWNDHLDEEASRKGIGAARKVQDLPGRLKDITAPTLVCTGDEDPNLVSSRKIAEGIANAELRVMENVGHGSVLQRPDLTAEIFVAFVKKHAGLD